MTATISAPGATGRVRHHFTVDVEEFFQVSAFDRIVSRNRWSAYPSRVEQSVDRLLQLLDEHDAVATFFTLGWIAERHGPMVRRIAGLGHEVASHGWGHRRVTDLTPDDFRTSVRRTRRVLEDTTGQPVRGYRAPSFSIVPGREWALEILVEEGYQYDSSLFPIHRPGYGYPAGGRYPYRLSTPAGPLTEIPPSTVRVAGVNLPASGGAYLRLLPVSLIMGALAQAERHGSPGTCYIHPWEVDPGQPRLAVPWLTRIRHYGGLRRTMGRLRRLLGRFSFQSIGGGLEALNVPADLAPCPPPRTHG